MTDEPPTQGLTPDVVLVVAPDAPSLPPAAAAELLNLLLDEFERRAAAKRKAAA